MDPNATLREIDEAVRNDDDMADEYCNVLYQWLAFHAFEPNWAKYPQGAKYYALYVERLGRE